MACTTGCRTKDHASMGECLRSKGVRFGMDPAKGFDATRQKRGDRELDEYEKAVRQGVQPKSTRLHDTRAAVEESNRTGEAFRA